MENILYVTAEGVSERQFFELIGSLGGDPNPEVGTGQGVVRAAEGNLYLAKLDPEDVFDPSDLIEVERLLGRAPATVIDIHVGRGRESCALAEQTARALIAKWGGTIVAS